MPNNTVSQNILGGYFCAALLLVFSVTACGGASLSTTATSGLTVTLATARSSGVAPLAVFFDATNTTDNAVTAHPFHDLQYTWSFGDANGTAVPGSGGVFGWNNGAASATAASCIATSDTPGCRNFATGAVAGHVYEFPGTYKATLTVFDGMNTVTKDTTITVSDPEVVFAGKTACVANGVTPSAGANGCPAVATLLYNSSLFDTSLTTAIAAGASRILFRRGDSFTSSSTTTLTTTGGPGMVGAYGSGASPSISSSAMSTYRYILSVDTSDWRIMDLTVSGPSTAVIGFLGQGAQASQITALRNIQTNMWSGYNFSGDQIAVVDSNISLGTPPISGSDGGWYCATCTNVMLLGNNMALGQTNSHNIRVQGTLKFVVSNSTQTGFQTTEPITVRGNTQYGVLSDNEFAATQVTVMPQNSYVNEYQRDIVFERNWFVGGGTLGLLSSGTTVRNNIFDLSLGLPRGITIAQSSSLSPMPHLDNIYNNTFYNSAANDGNVISTIMISYYSGLDATCNSSVENNLAYSPNTINLAPVLISNGSSCVVTGASGTFGNSSDSQIKNTFPSFASSTPVNPIDFRIGAGSYAYKMGVVIPVFSDFLQTAIPLGAISIGAFEGP